MSSCRAWLCLLALTVIGLPARATPEQDYLNVYLGMNDAERLKRAGDFRNALSEFEDCYVKLNLVRQNYRDWETVLVRSRLEDCRANILEMEDHLDGPPGQPFPKAMPDLSATLGRAPFCVYQLPADRTTLNDLAHLELAAKWVPVNWIKFSTGGKPASSCKSSTGRSRS